MQVLLFKGGNKSKAGTIQGNTVTLVTLRYFYCCLTQLPAGVQSKP